MARMWSGVVPQQPPVMLSQPASAHSRMKAAVSSGSSSYSAIALGSPALGWAETSVSAMRESSSTCGRSCRAPRAQLKPMESGLAWRTEFQNASGVCPDRVRPEASVIVPEIMIGSRSPEASKTLVDGEERRLGVEGVEDRLDQEDVRAALDERAHRLEVGVLHLVEAHGAEARVVHVRRERERAAHRAQHAGDEAGPRRVPRGELVRHAPRQARALAVQLAHDRLQVVVRLRDRGRVEGVGLEDVRARLEVLGVDLADHLRAGEGEEVVVAAQVVGEVPEALAAVLGLAQPVALHHGSHGPVQDEDALGQGLVEGLQAGGAVGRG